MFAQVDTENELCIEEGQEEGINLFTSVLITLCICLCAHNA